MTKRYPESNLTQSHEATKKSEEPLCGFV